MIKIFYLGIGAATVMTKQALKLLPTPGQAPSRWCRQSTMNAEDHLAEEHMHRVDAALLVDSLKGQGVIIEPL